MADGMAGDRAPLHLTLPRKMAPFTRPARHKVAHGGRGGGKSHSIAKLLLIEGTRRPLRWLCTRETQKSIKDSVHKLLADQIRAMNLGGFYDVQATTIKSAIGGEFLFAGLQDHTVDSIKSYEGCDGAWIEEAHSVSKRSAEVLIPTIRKEGSEIWWSFNPTAEEDYVYQRFIKRKDPNSVVVEINWRDNPWFPEVLEIERLRDKAIDEDLYAHVWEGQLRSIAGMLFKRKWFKRYDALPDTLNFYMASDYATTATDEDNPDPDFTEHGMFGLDVAGDLFATDWWFDQADPEVWINAAAAMVKRQRPTIWFEEKGVIRRSVDSSLSKRLRELDAWVYREGLASAGSKAERALGFAARASAGAVWFPQTPRGWDAERDGKHWSDHVIDQLCSFTGQDGKKDDAVDVCSLVARGLDRMANARPQPKPEESKVKLFTRQHIEAAEREQQYDEQEKAGYYR
jgi:phage terminase large subunit-like protein